MKAGLLFFLYFFNLNFTFSQQSITQDSLRVEELNLKAYNARLSSPSQAIVIGKQALALAKKIDFQLGIAEAYRVIGIGYSYEEESDTAIAKFLIAQSIFKSNHNLEGQARVLNNIGNLYKYYDFKKAIFYYNKCLELAKQIGFDELVAGCYMNIGYIRMKQRKYQKALELFNNSYAYFKNNKNIPGITISLQNIGFTYLSQNNLRLAEKYLLQANELAKSNNYYQNAAGSYSHLANLYIAKKEFKQAEEAIEQGEKFGKLTKSEEYNRIFTISRYRLEQARGNYKPAFYHLRDVFQLDSADFNKLESKKITLHKEQFDVLEKQKETEVLLEKQKTNRVIFAATIIVLVLSLLVIILLIAAFKKKTKTFKQLKALNEEISIQKENLNMINRNQEATIKERTLDLQVKNLKLSQYSSHLSHEIRSPISSIKGLLILEQEDLIDDKDLIQEIRKCVEDIDNKLLNINQMLHNPQYKAFVLPEEDSETPSAS